MGVSCIPRLLSFNVVPVEAARKHQSSTHLCSRVFSEPSSSKRETLAPFFAGENSWRRAAGRRAINTDGIAKRFSGRAAAESRKSYGAGQMACVEQREASVLNEWMQHDASGRSVTRCGGDNKSPGAAVSFLRTAGVAPLSLCSAAQPRICTLR